MSCQSHFFFYCFDDEQNIEFPDTQENRCLSKNHVPVRPSKAIPLSLFVKSLATQNPKSFGFETS